MAIESQERAIGDHHYTVQQFPAGASFTLLWEWKDVLGPALGVFAGGAVEQALLDLGGGKPGSAVLSLIHRSLEFTFLEGKPVGSKEMFDLHFAGKLGHLFRVIAFVLEVNYKDFFDEAREAIFSGVNKLDKIVQEVQNQLSNFQKLSEAGGPSSASQPQGSPTS